MNGEGVGRFVRTYWYERGIEHGNPKVNGRFRVNAPETSTDVEWMYRSEARGNGVMLIPIDEDLGRVEGAELYLEIWGGHPGTANKRATVNGRSTYSLPEVGTAAGHCTHMYPVVPLKIMDLVNGHNAFQFACDRGTASWGHHIVDNACLRVLLSNDHPILEHAGLTGFQASLLTASAPEQSETMSLYLSCPPASVDAIASVHYVGYCAGYDENGNGRTIDWHGFTKDRQPTAILGTGNGTPFAPSWNTALLPSQDNVAVRAVVRFKELPNVVYVTSTAHGLEISDRERSEVALYPSADLPAPFWSRAGQRKNCTIYLDVDPGQIERAALHVVVWDGGQGAVENPFTLNGHPLPVAGEGQHDVLYRVLDVQPRLLEKGVNEISVFSDTEHHGIEVLLPGPALMVRSQR
jgi:hypothetical protein